MPDRLQRIALDVYKGDQVGKNLVKMTVKGTGFETIDLGTDVDLARGFEVQ